MNKYSKHSKLEESQGPYVITNRRMFDHYFSRLSIIPYNDKADLVFNMHYGHQGKKDLGDCMADHHDGAHNALACIQQVNKELKHGIPGDELPSKP